jgi:hypothetical protein
MIRSSSARVPAFLTAGLLASAVVFACGGSNPPSDFGNDPDGGSGGGSGSGGASGSGSGGGGFGPGTGSGGPTSFDAACASQKSAGQQEPLDLYIMLDQSLSMNDQNKWTSVTAALNAFVGQQGLQGIAVGLQYFGLPPGGGGPSGCTNGAACNTDADCGGATCVDPGFGIPKGCFCGGGIGGGGPDSCTAGDYAKPEIEISALPGAAGAITASIGKHSPSTGTPTSAALDGAIQHAQSWSGAHAGHITAVVLATDGDPTGCDINMTNIEKLASDGASGAGGKPKILTFVIGVGSSLTSLNGIAAAGGTKQAYIVDTNGNAQQQFLDALNAIRGTAAGCQYQIPLPTNGGTPNYDQVNVEITPPGKPQVIAYKVTDKAACPPNPYFWYYDDNAKPTQIIFCDATCTQVMTDKSDEVDVLLGCGSLVK